MDKGREGDAGESLCSLLKEYAKGFAVMFTDGVREGKDVSANLCSVSIINVTHSDLIALQGAVGEAEHAQGGRMR